MGISSYTNVMTFGKTLRCPIFWINIAVRVLLVSFNINIFIGQLLIATGDKYQSIQISYFFFFFFFFFFKLAYIQAFLCWALSLSLFVLS